MHCLHYATDFPFDSMKVNEAARNKQEQSINKHFNNFTSQSCSHFLRLHGQRLRHVHLQRLAQTNGQSLAPIHGQGLAQIHGQGLAHTNGQRMAQTNGQG